MRPPVAPAALLAGLAVTLAGGSARAVDAHECIVASDQGQQLRDSHKLAAARERFASCASDACPMLIRSTCQKWLAQVTAEQPGFVVGVRDLAGHDLIQVRVFVDGVLATSTLDGAPLRVDPGEHVLRFDADGFAPAEQTLLARQAETNRQVNVILSPATAASPMPLTAPAVQPAGEPDQIPHSRTWNTVGWVLGGTGLLGLAAGASFGIGAIVENGDAHCNAEKQQCLEGPLGDARTLARASDVAFVAGGALLVAGVTLVLVMPRRVRREGAALEVVPTLTPTVGLRGAGLSFGARW
jgi:hypothetical protein